MKKKPKIQEIYEHYYKRQFNSPPKKWARVDSHMNYFYLQEAVAKREKSLEARKAKKA